jgi:hypothetical protein
MTDDKITQAIKRMMNAVDVGEPTMKEILDLRAERDALAVRSAEVEAAYKDANAQCERQQEIADDFVRHWKARVSELEAALAKADCLADAVLKFWRRTRINSTILEHAMMSACDDFKNAATEEARAQKQADEHRQRGGYVGGV